MKLKMNKLTNIFFYHIFNLNFSKKKKEKVVYKVDNEVAILKEGREKALKDFSTLWTDKSYSDLTIMVENKPIKVHKAILSCRSKYLSKMIENEVEKDPKMGDLIKINGKYNTISKVLEYIYTSNIVGIMDSSIDSSSTSSSSSSNTTPFTSPSHKSQKVALSPPKNAHYLVSSQSVSDNNLLDILQTSFKFNLDLLSIWTENCLYTRFYFLHFFIYFYFFTFLFLFYFFFILFLLIYFIIFIIFSLIFFYFFIFIVDLFRLVSTKEKNLTLLSKILKLSTRLSTKFRKYISYLFFSKLTSTLGYLKSLDMKAIFSIFNSLTLNVIFFFYLFDNFFSFFFIFIF